MTVCLTASVAQRDVSGPGTPGKCAEDRLNLEETKGSCLQVTSNCVWSSLCSQFQDRAKILAGFTN